MPWSNGVYSLPAGTNVSPNETIESSWANSLTQDIASAFNTDTPILAGGTGASTAVGALDNLFAQSTSIASATTTDLSTATGNYVEITGTTTITGFGTVSAGSVRILRFSGALTLTHNATSLILPGGANITTAAGDVAVFVSEGSGNWRCALFQRAASLPYDKNSVLGTVSETAGVPTGAVIETGSNSNGEYTKWADGTMICRHRTSDSVTISTSLSFGGYRSNGLTWTYPQEFSSSPRLTFTVANITAFGGTAYASSATEGTYYFTAINQIGSSGTRNADLTAIGKWFE